MKNILIVVVALNSVFLYSQNITSAEYFFDVDKGVNSGVSLTVDSNTGELIQTYNISTSGLTDGFHSLYLRTYNSDNNWSLYDRQTFYLKSFDSFTIKSAEYFFDEDNGVGNETSLDINNNSGQLSQVFSIPTSGLSEGFHNFYIRTKDNTNNWSLYDSQVIYIKDFDFTPDDVSNAEYFIDEDMGVGTGISIVFGNSSQTSHVLNIDSTGLADGEHLFYVRVQDSNGDWSIYDTAIFIIDNNLDTEDSLFKATKILPNPIENRLTIKLSDNAKILKTKIYNNLGQIVYSSFEDKKTLELSHLSSGIYILNIETNQDKASFKIVKQ